MTELIRSLSQIAPRYDALFCDLWGCVHNGVSPFPAAVSALQSFRQGGGRVILVTNAPRPKASVVAQLDRMGLPRDAWDDVATSGDAAQQAMLAGAVGHKVFHIGADKDEPFFSDLSTEAAAIAATGPAIQRVALAEAQGIVCTGLADDLTETPEDYRATLLMAKAMDLPFLCANPDLVVDMGDKRLYCAGALAALYEQMGGMALYFGKPHPPVYDLARRLLAMQSDRPDPQILCVGDGVGTDIRGGMGEGLDTLFITGGIAAGEFGPDPLAPDTGLLQRFLDREQLSATFAIPMLA